MVDTVGWAKRSVPTSPRPRRHGAEGVPLLTLPIIAAAVAAILAFAANRAAQAEPPMPQIWDVKPGTVNRRPIIGTPRIASSAIVTLVAQSALTIRCEPIG